MEYIKLGNTGIEVSRLCFGGLTVGPLQANLHVDKGAEVIKRALELGVNFIDTAELYKTYPCIKEAIRGLKNKPVVATKTYAYTAEMAKKSLERARIELGLDVIDIFLLHEQESKLTLRGHREALEYFISEKEKGRIKAVGISTHNIEAVDACAQMPEIDVIHPLINMKGIGIADGTVEEMVSAINAAYDAGKGIYSMKPLGGGNLLRDYNASLKFVMDIPYIHSIAMGMQSVEEVEMNICVFNNEEIPERIKKALSQKERRLHIEAWCEGCGKCKERCRQNALELVNGKAVVDMGRCVLCGYCGSDCPAFAIKVI